MRKRTARLRPAAISSDAGEAALSIIVAYEDSLTRRWAWDLWRRVGRLTGSGGICRKAWRIANFSRPGIFAEAALAAAKADMLIIAVRDAEKVPRFLDLWIDAWLPQRAKRPGALVALIGVPARPDAQSGYAHQLLEAVARQAGLDYLPRERKLPEESTALRWQAVVPASALLALAL